MRNITGKLARILPLALALGAAPGSALAFDSGSTGADGAFSPTVNTQLQVPASGVFNFTTVNIPAGVTVTFAKNTTNTPVVMLASGDVTVAGTIDVSGTRSTNVGAAGDGNLGDDGQPGVGGPGGYDGGAGALPGGASTRGSDGLGPGAGKGGAVESTIPSGGGGAGFGAVGTASHAVREWGASYFPTTTGQGGAAYGSSLLLPLIGGSGGGGSSFGGTGFNYAGSGGGGGGGALLLAATGTLTVSGSILANGGSSGTSSGAGASSTGGGGSGGAIRLIASTMAGNGTISATGGTVGGATIYYMTGGNGASGRIRLEADSITRTAATNPAYTFGAPGSVFLSGLPTLTISSVAGVAAPAAPTGNADITLPSTTTNPVTVQFTTTGVPVGNTVTLTVTPAYGEPIVATSPALSGTTQSASASVSVNLPAGPSVLSATTTYTIVVALGDALSTYAQGERVEKVRLSAVLHGPSTVTLITVSGKEYTVPAAAVAGMLAAG